MLGVKQGPVQDGNVYAASIMTCGVTGQCAVVRFLNFQPPASVWSHSIATSSVGLLDIKYMCIAVVTTLLSSLEAEIFALSV